LERRSISMIFYKSSEFLQDLLDSTRDPSVCVHDLYDLNQCNVKRTEPYTAGHV